MPNIYEPAVSVEIQFEGGGSCQLTMLKSSADRMLKEIERAMKGEEVQLHRFRVSGTSSDAEVILLRPEKVLYVRIMS